MPRLVMQKSSHAFRGNDRNPPFVPEPLAVTAMELLQALIANLRQPRAAQRYAPAPFIQLRLRIPHAPRPTPYAYFPGQDVEE